MGEMKKHKILVGKLKGGNHLDDPGIDVRILRWNFRDIESYDMDWINVAQNRVQW
jgi:hypothetical protein